MVEILCGVASDAGKVGFAAEQYIP